MKTPNRPAGRHPYQRVSVLKLPGQGRVVLGESEPVEDDRRTRAQAQWGPSHPSPRQQPLATIDTPLPPRIQTVLSYLVAPALRRQLNGGTSAPPASRRAAEAPVQARLTISIEPNAGEATESSDD